MVSGEAGIRDQEALGTLHRNRALSFNSQWYVGSQGSILRRGGQKVSLLEGTFKNIYTNIQLRLEVPIQMSLQVRKFCFLLSEKFISQRGTCTRNQSLCQSREAPRAASPRPAPSRSSAFAVLLF